MQTVLAVDENDDDFFKMRSSRDKSFSNIANLDLWSLNDEDLEQYFLHKV